jgi:hypothetical protein
VQERIFNALREGTPPSAHGRRLIDDRRIYG